MVGRLSAPADRRLLKRGLITLCCGYALSASPVAAQQGSGDDQPDNPVLHVQFRLTKGRFAVDREASGILGKDAAFSATYRRPRKEIEARLLDILDSALASGDKALTLVGETCPTAEAPGPEANRAICELDARWPDAQGAFAQWVRVQHSDYPLPANYLPNSVFKTAFVNRGTLAGLLGNGTLSVPGDVMSGASGNALYNGQVDLVVKPPITDGQIAACHAEPIGDGCIIDFADSASAKAFEHHITRAALADVLKPLRGELWDLGRIDRQLGDLLLEIGIQTYAPDVPKPPDLSLSGANGDQETPFHFAEILPNPDPDSNGILVSAPPRLSQIEIALTHADFGATRPDARPDENEAVRKILYLLLPRHDFEALIARGGPGWMKPTTIEYETGKQIKAFVLDLPSAAAAGAMGDPYVNQRTVSDKLGSVQQLGYQATLSPDNDIDTTTLDDKKWARILVFPSGGWDKAAQADAGTAGNPAVDGQPAAAADADPDGRKAAAKAREDARKAAGKKPVQIAGPFHNFISVGGGGETGQPATFFVEYRRDEVLGGDSLDVRAGDHGKSFISGNYQKDFLDFMGLNRRLTLNVAGASNYNPAIPVGTGRADERRTGGSVSASLEVLRDANRNWLQMRGEFGYEDVALDQPASTPSPAPAPTSAPSEQISHATLGLTYNWLGNDRINVPAITLEPNLTHGWGSGATRPYWKASLLGTAHAAFQNFFEYDLRSSTSWVSSGTPLTELPRLGGDETLRGLRQDAAAGTFVWSLQNELWVPLRFSERLGPAIDGLVRNDLKLAFFSDMGGASRNLQNLPGFNVSAGLGLRYNLKGQATLRLDYAHLLTRSDSSLGRQGVYFSIIIMPLHY